MRSIPLFAEAGATLRLATPLIAGQLSQMLMGVVDTAMIGPLGTTELAASALVTNLSHIPLVFAIGLLSAIPVRVSQARGAEDTGRAGAVLRDGLWLAAGMGALTLLGMGLILTQLHRLGQDPAVTEMAPVFLKWIALSMVPAFLSLAVKGHADALNRPWPPFWITLGGVFLNVLLNWLLIRGNAGCPALGLAGAGVATLISRSAILAGLMIWLRSSRSLRDWIPRRWWSRPDPRSLASLAGLGLPAALQTLAEVSAFVASTFLAGTLGETALAAHHVALVCAASVFMVPLGLSMAVTVRIGAAIGSGSPGAPRPVFLSALLLAAGFTLVSFGVIAGGRRGIAACFIPDAATLETAAALLLISAVFQAGDAVQVISVGALRGLEDVRFPARAAFAAHWLLGLPVGYWLAFPRNMGVTGIWWGLTFGLSTCALLFSLRFWNRSGATRSG
ncbi:MAG: MATE family efflux transporter [Verrucomicrobia bacterium]|nr:MATE family efflux transporter [Verrucomicrobiota bacterium]